MANFIGICIGSLAVAFFTAYSILVNTFVLQCLWSWFIVPVFPIEPLSFVAAMGVAIVVSYLTASPSASFLLGEYIEDNTKRILKYTVSELIRPWYLLLVGFIITLFL